MSKPSSGVFSLVILVGSLTGIYLGTAVLMDRDLLRAMVVPAALLVLYVAIVFLGNLIAQRFDGKYEVYEGYKALWLALQSRRIRRSKEV